MFKGITIDICIIMLVAVVFVPAVGIFFSEGSVLYNIFMIVVCTIVMAIGIVLAENRFDNITKNKTEADNLGNGPDWMP